jgi:hypothetical protein
MGQHIPGGDAALIASAAILVILLAAMAGAAAFGQAPPDAGRESTQAKAAVADPPLPVTPYDPQASMPTGRTLLALGTVFTVIGIALTGAGAWALATVRCWDCPTDGFPAPGTAGGAMLALGLLHLIPGIPMLIVGASRHASYRKAVREQMALEKDRILLTPSLAILPEGGAMGALTVRF